MFISVVVEIAFDCSVPTVAFHYLDITHRTHGRERNTIGNIKKGGEMNRFTYNMKSCLRYCGWS